MILVMDVGNTQTTVGLYRESELVHQWRLTTAHHRSQDEWGALFQSLFHFNGLTMEDVSGVAICSVVPPADLPLREMVKRYFGCPPFFIAAGVKTGLKIFYDSPAEVGADRVVNAVAAFQAYGGPAIVVDLGTATTFDMIGEGGDYLGGVIAPGLAISAEALFERAAKLPKVEIAKPAKVIGRTTVGSMQSGLFWGYVGLIEGILKRMKREFGEVKHVVATGGLAPTVAKEVKAIDSVDENLTLEGIRLLYERNR